MLALLLRALCCLQRLNLLWLALLLLQLEDQVPLLAHFRHRLHLTQLGNELCQFRFNNIFFGCLGLA